MDQRRLLHPPVRVAVVTLLAMLQIACSRALVFADRYANCVNLGDLSALSSNRRDAEQRMTARVRELGGDTLIFGERGRTEQFDELPEEIVVRRDELLTSTESGAGQAVIATTSSDDADDIADDANELTSAEPNGDQRRIPRVSWEEVPAVQGERWYYGAALRCNVAE